jgi:hypothetical protein
MLLVLKKRKGAELEKPETSSGPSVKQRKPMATPVDEVAAIVLAGTAGESIPDVVGKFKALDGSPVVALAPAIKLQEGLPPMSPDELTFRIMPSLSPPESKE